MATKLFHLKKFVFLLSLISTFLFISRTGYAGYFETPIATTKLMWLAGMDFTIDGSPAQIGDEIAIFVPGIQTPVGLYIVDTIGQYGIMLIYGDDGTKPGALSGQVLTDFRVYDTSTSTLITNVQPVIPGSCISVFCPPASLPITYQTTGTIFSPPAAGTLLNIGATSIVLDTTAPATTASPAGGTYGSQQNVTLTCNDGSGSGCANTYYCTGSGCTPATVYNSAIALYTTTTLRFYSKDNSNNSETVKSEVYAINTSPTADFTGSPASGTAPLTVSFTNSSTGYDTPLTYEWDFDNNGTVDSILLNPSYEYTNAGTYSVKLTVTDSDGSANVLTRLDYISASSCLSPVRVTGTVNSYYTSPQPAYDDAWEDDDIDFHETSFNENLIFNTNKRIRLRGGYDCDYTTTTGKTVINGNVTINNGVVTMENIIIQ